MNDAEKLDEATAKAVKVYARLGYFSLFVREHDDGLRVIYPEADPDAVAKVLREAALMIETKRDTGIQ